MPSFAGSVLLKGIHAVLVRSDGHPELVVLADARDISNERAGYFLGSLRPRLPGGSAVTVLFFGGSAPRFAQRWKLADRGDTRVVEIPSESSSEVRKAFHVGTGSVAFLYDNRSTWRATYQAGQMVPADVVHDMSVIDH